MQDARKQAGLEVTDRIELELGGDAELLDAARQHESYVSEETLALSVSYSDDGSGEGATIDGRELLIWRRTDSRRSWARGLRVTPLEPESEAALRAGRRHQGRSARRRPDLSSSPCVLGVWKYRQMASSPDGLAHPYVDTAHRAALLYSFATLLIAVFVELSGWSDDGQPRSPPSSSIFFFLARDRRPTSGTAPRATPTTSSATRSRATGQPSCGR